MNLRCQSRMLINSLRDLLSHQICRGKNCFLSKPSPSCFAVSDAPALWRKLQTTSADIYLERDFWVLHPSLLITLRRSTRWQAYIPQTSKRKCFHGALPHTLPCRPRSCRRNPAGNGGCYIFNVYGSQISVRIWAREVFFFFCIHRRKTWAQQREKVAKSGVTELMWSFFSLPAIWFSTFACGLFVFFLFFFLESLAVLFSLWGLLLFFSFLLQPFEAHTPCPQCCSLQLLLWNNSVTVPPPTGQDWPPVCQTHGLLVSLGGIRGTDQCLIWRNSSRGPNFYLGKHGLRRWGGGRRAG